MTDSKLGRTRARILAEATAYTATRWGHSKWAEIGRCEVGYHLRYTTRIQERRPRAAFEIGKAVHSGRAAMLLADLYQIEPIGDDGRWLYEHAVERADVADVCDEARGAIYPRVEALRLLAAYHAHYGLEHGGFGPGARTVGVEELVEAPAPMHYTTRVDAMVELGGEVMNVDTKTRAAKVPDTFDASCYTDTQFLGHTYCVWKATGKLLPMLVDVIVKSKVPTFSRHIIRYTPEHLQLWATAQQEVERRALPIINHPERAIRNFSSCAPAFGAKCWAYEWCWGTDADRELLYTKG